MKVLKSIRQIGQRLGRDDSGMALMTVVAASAVVFVMLATTLTMVEYRDNQTTRYSGRNRAMQLADAGLNEYMYQLSEDYRFYSTNPSLEPAAPLTDGTWVVTATPPDDDELLTLTSTGTLNNGMSRTITATVKFPNFVDYCVFVIEDYSVGSGFTFDGKVYVQGWLNMATGSNITGLAMSSRGFKRDNNTLTLTNNRLAAGTAPYSGGARKLLSPLTMDSVTNDLAAIAASATAGGIYLPPYTTAKYGTIPAATSTKHYTARQGYRLTFSGATVRVEAVVSEQQENGALTISTTAPLASGFNVPIPANGIIYVDGPVWVQGTYSQKVTVAVPSPYDIIVPDDLLCSSTSPRATCGLVSGGDVAFPHWYDSMPEDLYVQAAMLSQNGFVNLDRPRGGTSTYYYPQYWKYASSYASNKKNSINLIGSRAMDNMGAGLAQGFVIRNSEPDPRLYDDPPPMYPNVQGEELKVMSWSEH